ncbi:MAG: ribonucleoside triphosphate reductase [Candidatus Aerophobetes bacterium]|nr:ribonucleoside triphosphate reductase [Candidatus Aerophobetes bacterium]
MVKNSKIKKIKKRDGRIVFFNPQKIKAAIRKAIKAVDSKDGKRAAFLTKKVVELAEKRPRNNEILTVEDIQDIVEEVLIKQGDVTTAKAYIIYRQQHKDIRKVKSLLDETSVVENYLSHSDWRVRENSNMSYSLQGLNVHISYYVIANYWLTKIYPPEVAKAHKEGDFHLHDLGVLGVYCVGWDLEDLLRVGFRGVPWKLESKPAKHLSTALMQCVNFMYTLQGEAAGAIAFSNFDTLLTPFIRYDKLDYKEVKQALQVYIFNMNVPTRVGFQTPFSNVTLDLQCPSYMKDMPVIIGGKAQKEKYGDFQKEMDMFNRVFAEVLTEGDANGKPFTFPIPTYNLAKDFDWDNKNLNPIWEMTAKYGIPYFANFINSDMDPEDARSMCCRLRLDNRELRKRGGGLFGSNPLTGSIGVVTINMPRIGYLARLHTKDPQKAEEKFFAKLEELMNLAKESLVIKRKTLEKFTENGLYPYSAFYLRSVKDATGSYWKNHFSTIGLIGMNEAVLNLMGKEMNNDKSIKFVRKVLDFMREKLADYQQETGDIYNLEATPAEGASYSLARLDQKKYPQIKIHRRVEEKGDPYYTNSSQLPVDLTDDIFEALDLQDDLQIKYTGGTVLHGFLGEKMPSNQSVRKLVKKIALHYRLPYFTLTPTFSICPLHGYLSGEHEFCPKCKKENKKTPCEIYSRVVGYLRPVSQWNTGKQQEFKDRKTYDRQLTSH